jgi:hypothetical protein
MSLGQRIILPLVPESGITRVMFPLGALGVHKSLLKVKRIVVDGQKLCAEYVSQTYLCVIALGEALYI